MSTTISSLSLVFVRVQVNAVKNGSPFDPTGDAVLMAFVPIGSKPSSGDWKTATWETEGAGSGNVRYQARCLVGPSGAVQLAPGQYPVWVKITDSPEVPVMVSDMLTVI